jgi:quercetin dioxygenase-like cupin family protein
MSRRDGSNEATMSHDPVTTNPDLYSVLFENDRVRVLEYIDKPGDRTTPHRHPDSVMYTLGSFRRRLSQNGRQVDVELSPGQVRWVSAQEHSGENIGDTGSHSIFVELKEPPPARPSTSDNPLGPSAS